MLKTYLLLFLHSSPSLLPGHDYEQIVEGALNTYVLGEYVAPKWSLGPVMKWTPVKISPQVSYPNVDWSKLDEKTTKGVGLYKVQGTVVESLMGGIFHQYVRSDYSTPLHICQPDDFYLCRSGWFRRTSSIPHKIIAPHLTSRQACRFARHLPCQC